MNYPEILPLFVYFGLLAALLVTCGRPQAPTLMATPPEPGIHIHYLGHSAFIL
jgi:hypothetical protein